jgi:hypothetical protein
MAALGHSTGSPTTMLPSAKLVIPAMISPAHLDQRDSVVIFVPPQQNAVADSECSGLVAGHLCRLPIRAVLIPRLPCGPHDQPAGIEAPYRPALLRNLSVVSVDIHTAWSRWIKRSGTGGHRKEQQCRSGHKCKGDFHRNSLFTSHHRIYICFAALRARVQPERLPCALYRLARAIVAENCDFRRSFAWSKD